MAFQNSRTWDADIIPPNLFCTIRFTCTRLMVFVGAIVRCQSTVKLITNSLGTPADLSGQRTLAPPYLQAVTQHNYMFEWDTTESSASRTRNLGATSTPLSMRRSSDVISLSVAALVITLISSIPLTRVESVKFWW